MPFIRYTRDKRGNETTYVMHAYRGGQGGTQQTRVLYLFRSPAHVRMGRRPLDEEAREALEHTHPDLSFDWTVLSREGETVRAEERSREGRRQGRGRGGAAAPPAPAVIDDQTLLGRTLGAAAAARLRTRFTDVVDRINRRARTPEQRDRLIEAAQRLNPDDWQDAESIRAHADTIDAEYEAILAELPARRRSRRGRREAGREADDVPGEGVGEDREPDEGSAIMAGEGENDDSKDVLDITAADGGGRDRDDTGGDGPGGVISRSGDDLPDDDELRQD